MSFGSNEPYLTLTAILLKGLCCNPYLFFFEKDLLPKLVVTGAYSVQCISQQRFANIFVYISHIIRHNLKLRKARHL